MYLRYSIEDPASHGYYREEGGGLMIGLFEPVCAPWKIEGIPEDSSFTELAPDWERMTPFLERAMSRVPITSEVGIRKFFCGPESFTPDNNFIMGEAPELKNLFVAAGFNSVGIASAGLSLMLKRVIRWTTRNVNANVAAVGRAVVPPSRHRKLLR
jgi:4-methylaminobutanoate oxidase (formaldehyde-forming)